MIQRSLSVEMHEKEKTAASQYDIETGARAHACGRRSER